MAALVGADRHPLDVLLDRRPDHLVDRAVVAEVDDLGPLGLEQAPHDVDGGVVPVEQAGRGHEPDRMDRSVEVAHAGTGWGWRRGAAERVITPYYYDVLLNWPGRWGCPSRSAHGRAGHPSRPSRNLATGVAAGNASVTPAAK